MFQKNHLRLPAIFIQATLCVLIFHSCQNETEVKDPASIRTEKLKADASFNNSIVPGVGNVFYESDFIPNSSSQLVAKLAFNEDTVAFFGSTNALGQVEYIHTTVLAKNNNTELLITEIFPEVFKSRMYTIINGNKSRFITEIQRYNETDLEVSLLDYDWTTGEFTTLESALISNGVVDGQYSAERKKDRTNVWNCDTPQPAEDFSTDVDNHIAYFMCGGHAFDSYPGLEAMKKLVVSAMEKYAEIDSYNMSEQELNIFANSFSMLSDILQSVKGKFSEYKFEKTRLASILKTLEDLYQEANTEALVELNLIPFLAASDTDFDEYSDDNLKISLTLTDAATGLPYVKQPVYVDLRLFIPGTNEYLYEETKPTNPVNGILTFKIDPLPLKDYGVNTLEARYAFTKDDWSKSASQTVTLKFIEPQVTLYSGNNQAGTLGQALSESLKVKVTDIENRPLENIEVAWSIQKGSGQLSADKSFTSSEGVASIDLILDEVNEVQQVLATVKRKDGSLANGAPVLFSFTAKESCGLPPVITDVIVKCLIGTGSDMIAEIHFSDHDGGFDPTASYYGFYTPESYPVKIDFLNAGMWNHAANSHIIKLIAGDHLNGVIQATLSYSPGSCEQTDYYKIEKKYYDGWRVSLTDECGNTSNEGNYSITYYSAY